MAIGSLTHLFASTLILLASTATAVYADSILVGTTNTLTGGITDGNLTNPSNSYSLAQEFTLTSAVTISSISVLENGGPTGGATLQLTDAIGVPSPTIYASGTFDWSDGQGFITSTIPVADVELQPGTYYLVMSSSSSDSGGWGLGGSVVSTPYGSVGSSYLGIATTDANVSSPFQSSGVGVLDFQIDGDPVAPEPATFVLAGIGLLAAGIVSRKRRPASFMGRN